jgi:Holliday junction resolvase
MPSTQTKGRQLEYAVRRTLQSLGFVVLRCAGSRPVDLIAFREGTIFLVECKTGVNPRLPEQQAKRILRLAEKISATFLLTILKKHRGIRWFNVSAQGIHEIDPPRSRTFSDARASTDTRRLHLEY